MERSTVMALVLVPWVYTYWKTSQILHIKYVQLLHDNYISTKHLKKLLYIKIWSPIHFRNLEDLATLHWRSSLSCSCLGSKNGWLCDKRYTPGVQDLPSLSPYSRANVAIAVARTVQGALVPTKPLDFCSASDLSHKTEVWRSWEFLQSLNPAQSHAKEHLWMHF